MPKAPNKPVRKNPKKPKKSKGGEDKSKTKKGAGAAAATLALLSIFLALPVAAADVYPYLGLTGDRLSDIERWSTGVTIGADVTRAPVCFNVHADIHDILANKEDNVYPWDLTVGGGAGMFKTIDVGGIEVTASGLLTLNRPSDVDRFSFGVLVAGEAAFDNLYGEVSLHWLDVLTAEEHQVYDWDQTLRLAVGYYLGDPPSSKAAEKGGS